MNELDKNSQGELVRVEARIRLFEAIQSHKTDLSKAVDYYLEYAEDICLEHDFTFVVKIAKMREVEIPTREEILRQESLRRYHLDFQVATRFMSEDPSILGPIKNLHDLIGVEKRKKIEIISGGN